MQQRDPENTVLDYASTGAVRKPLLGIVSVLLFGCNVVLLWVAWNAALDWSDAWTLLWRLSVSVAISFMGLVCGYKARRQRAWNQFGSVVGTVLHSIMLALELPVLLTMLLLRLGSH